MLAFHQRMSAGGPQADPVSGRAWDGPEVAATVAVEELKAAPALSEADSAAIIAFLKTLTDKRYERLLD